jgi:hypothetical protein
MIFVERPISAVLLGTAALALVAALTPGVARLRRAAFNG